MPDRIQLRRTAGWRLPAGAVSVARPTKWGNPWKPGDPARFWLPGYPVADPAIGCALDAEDVVQLYRRLVTHGPDPLNRHLPAMLSPLGRRRTRDDLRAHAARILADLPTLAGLHLGCFCSLDAPCHADVLLEIANA